MRTLFTETPIGDIESSVLHEIFALFFYFFPFADNLKCSTQK